MSSWLYLRLQKTSKAGQKASKFRRPSTPRSFSKVDYIWQIAFSPYCAALLEKETGNITLAKDLNCAAFKKSWGKLQQNFVPMLH